MCDSGGQRCKNYVICEFFLTIRLISPCGAGPALAIELTALEMVLGGILAFLAGLFGLLFYYERRTTRQPAQSGQDPTHYDRLEQYENQLIGMKIRLDALSLGGAEPAAQTGREDEGPEDDPGTIDSGQGGTGAKKAVVAEPAAPAAVSSTEQPPAGPYDITNHILQLITSKSMTSRDIQITIGRTREHTSRLMKRLSEEGFVKRHSGSRPYTYSITERGKERLKASRV